tara:strand:- start:20513 stop:21595 length:1083 start_codon:yes stop_codon:yes gene_type:complete
MYDYLVVGSGLYGSIFAYEATKVGKKVLVIEKRDHIGGNVYTKNEDGIHVHMYGPHHFHTNSKRIWDYINQFAPFRTCDLNNLAFYKGRLYTLPINLKTFHEVWGVTTEEDARQKIEEVRIPIENPDNAEDYLLSKVGLEIYSIFFEGYTTRQWGKSPKEVSADVVKRIPIRFDCNCQYHHNAIYSGVPVGGYTQIFDNLLSDTEVRLNADFFVEFRDWRKVAKKLVYSGPIDKLGDYKFGRLGYRSLKFKHERHEGSYQGNPIIAYTDVKYAFNRITEHKFFDYQGQKHTIITKEYPEKYTGDNTPYYPVGDKEMLQKYKQEFKMYPDILIGGRLGEHIYYDMDQVVASSLKLVDKELK